MNYRYQNERPLTLSEAKLVFGYTSDHLAYLCRKGFVWAQRHGRAWLTCEKAISDYKRVLEIAGKPVILSEQATWLGKTDRAKKTGFNFALDWDRVEGAWNRFVGFELVPKIAPQHDQFLIAAERERAQTQNRPRSFVYSVFEADLGYWLSGVIGAYQEVFFRPRLTESYFSKRSASCFNFSLGCAPKNLPAAPLPGYLSIKPWYRHELILVPALSVLMLALVVSQAALLNTFMI